MDKVSYHRANREIIGCAACNCRGAYEQSEITDYHKNEKRYWHTLCSVCGGEGRVVLATYNISVTMDINGKLCKHGFEKNVIEKLDGRTTKEFYKIK